MQQVSRQPLRPAIVVAAVAAFAATGAMTAACSRSSYKYVNCVDDNGTVVDPKLCENCVDENGKIVDDSNCENGKSSTHRAGLTSGYWYYTSGRRYQVGSHAPSNWQSSRISPSDSAARSKAGLPSSGKIGGTKVSSGGFGKGSSHKSSSKSGGS